MKFLSLDQFAECWHLQDSLNTATSGPDWKEKNQNWNLAIKSEVMEFFDYISWKWWKEPDKVKSPKDMQARLELVDIWHFLLSHIIEIGDRNGVSYEYAALNSYLEPKDEVSFNDCKISMMSLDGVNVNNFQKVLFLSDALTLCEWTWDELYKAYIGKVALNNFRQANGYKEGTYQKIWEVVVVDTSCGGDTDESREDNYFLEKILQELSLTEGALTYEAVYHKLGFEYMIRTTE